MEFDAIFWIVVITVGFCLVTLSGVFVFGLSIYRLPWRNHFLAQFLESVAMLLHEVRHKNPMDKSALEATKEISNAIEGYLDRRNKFWELFGQIALAVVVVLVVAILLLTKTIDADAGLPILTAVVAFVIGKGIDTKGAGRNDVVPPRDPESRGE